MASSPPPPNPRGLGETRRRQPPPPLQTKAPAHHSALTSPSSSPTLLLPPPSKAALSSFSTPRVPSTYDRHTPFPYTFSPTAQSSSRQKLSLEPQALSPLPTILASPVWQKSPSPSAIAVPPRKGVLKKPIKESVFMEYVDDKVVKNKKEKKVEFNEIVLASPYTPRVGELVPVEPRIVKVVYGDGMVVWKEVEEMEDLRLQGSEKEDEARLEQFQMQPGKWVEKENMDSAVGMLKCGPKWPEGKAAKFDMLNYESSEASEKSKETRFKNLQMQPVKHDNGQEVDPTFRMSKWEQEWSEGRAKGVKFDETDSRNLEASVKSQDTNSELFQPPLGVTEAGESEPGSSLKRQLSLASTNSSRSWPESPASSAFSFERNNAEPIQPWSPTTIIQNPSNLTIDMSNREQQRPKVVLNLGETNLQPATPTSLLPMSLNSAHSSSAEPSTLFLGGLEVFPLAPPSTIAHKVGKFGYDPHSTASRRNHEQNHTNFPRSPREANTLWEVSRASDPESLQPWLRQLRQQHESSSPHPQFVSNIPPSPYQLIFKSAFTPTRLLELVTMRWKIMGSEYLTPPEGFRGYNDPPQMCHEEIVWKFMERIGKVLEKRKLDDSIVWQFTMPLSTLVEIHKKISEKAEKRRGMYEKWVELRKVTEKNPLRQLFMTPKPWWWQRGARRNWWRQVEKRRVILWLEEKVELWHWALGRMEQEEMGMKVEKWMEDCVFALREVGKKRMQVEDWRWGRKQREEQMEQMKKRLKEYGGRVGMLEMVQWEYGVRVSGERDERIEEVEGYAENVWWGPWGWQGVSNIWGI